MNKKVFFLPVLPNLQFGSCEYQHFQCEKNNSSLFFRKKCLYLLLKKTLLP